MEHTKGVSPGRVTPFCMYMVPNPIRGKETGWNLSGAGLK